MHLESHQGYHSHSPTGHLFSFVKTQTASHPGADLVQAGSDGFCRTVTLEHVTFQHMCVFIPSHVCKIPKKTKKANKQMLKNSDQSNSSDATQQHYISTMQEIKGLVVNNEEQEETKQRIFTSHVELILKLHIDI